MKSGAYKACDVLHVDQLAYLVAVKGVQDLDLYDTLLLLLKRVSLLILVSLSDEVVPSGCFADRAVEAL